MITNPTKFGLNVGQELQHGSSIFPGKVFPTQQWINDMAEWKRVKFNLLRQGGNNANFQDAVNLQHTAVALELANGFDVTYVLQTPFGSHMSDYTGYYSTYMLPDAQWAQAAGVQTIIIGNERENGTTNSTAGLDPITSMTRSSNVVTVVMPTQHNLATGDAVLFFAGANHTGSAQIGISNNTFISSITVVDNFTFTFSNTGSNGTTSTGYFQDSNRSVFSRYKRYATQLIADSITVPLWYSCLQGLESATHNDFNITRFATMGKGDLTGLAVNSYGAGNVNPSTPGIPGAFQSFMDECNAALAMLSTSTFMVTEWNLGSTNTTNVSSNNIINREYNMKRLRFLNKLGVRHYHFCWRFPDSRLQLKNDISYNLGNTPAYKQSNISDPTFNDWWWDFINERPKTVTVGAPFINANIQTIANNRFAVSQPAFTNLGMNYGQSEQGQGTTFNAAAANVAFTTMKALGIKQLRIPFLDIITGNNTVMKQCMLLAKSYGFYVIAVCAASGLNDSNWSTYTAAVNTYADWALTNNIDEFQVGNEIEYFETTTPFALTNSVSKIKTMAADVKSNHFTSGIVSYAMAQSAMEYIGAPNGWITQGRGVLELGYNGYGDNGDYTQWAQRTTDLITAFGSHVYLTEWNLNNNWSNFPSNEATQDAQIAQRNAFIISSGIARAFFFTWSWTQSSDQFAIFKANGTFRTWKNILFIAKPRTLTPNRTLTTGRNATP